MRTSRRISRTGLRKPLKSGPSMIEPEATECVDRPSHPLLATDKSTASLLCCRLDPVAHVVPAVVVYPIVCGVNFREQDFSSVLVYLPFAERIGPPRIRSAVHVLHVVNVYAEQAIPLLVALRDFIADLMAQSGSYFPIGVSISNHEGSLTNSLLDVLPLVEFAGKSPSDRFDGLTCRQRPYPREPVARTRESRLN